MTHPVPALVPVDQIERMAVAVSKSGLFGAKTPEQAMALMLIAQAEGLHPAIAARDYHIINGRPALKADAMLARFQAAGGRVKWLEMTDVHCEGEFSHPAGGTVTIEWTIQMAERAGLMKNQTWKQYPRQMLRARCVSEGIRSVFPGVLVGTYTPEEIEDMPPAQTAQPAPKPRPAPAPSPVVEVLSFEDIMRRIDRARTVDELNALKPSIKLIDKELRNELNDAARVRADQIRAEEADQATIVVDEEPV